MVDVLQSTTFLVAVIGILVLPAFALPIRDVLVCNPTTWADIVVFFGTNYFAHAATIASIPGVPWYDTVLWTTIGLLMPFAGLGKALALIFRHFAGENSDLEKAAARGAVVVVVRSEEWEPSTQPEEIYVELPKDFDLLPETGSDPLPSASIRYTKPSNDVTTAIDHRQMRVHGSAILPPGYGFALPDMVYLCEYFPFHSRVNKSITLSRSQSYVKMAVSVAQLVYSVITIYRTKGNQLDRYGYAAFGLSVIPYAFMSLVNLICVGVVGDYTHLYMLRTDIMREAALKGGWFAGAIGGVTWEDGGEGRKVADEKDEYGSMTDTEDGETPPDLERWTSFTSATLSLESGGPSDGDGTLFEKIMVVKVDDITRKFKFHPSPKYISDDDSSPPSDYVFKISPYSNQREIPRGCYITPTTSALHDILQYMTLLAIPLALALPYVIIYFLSGFHKEQSTVAERGWMMAWLSSGQLAFLILGLLIVDYPSLSFSTLGDTWRGSGLVVIILPLIIAPIGGLFMVGKMLMEFGTCELSP
ncbi:hypothetical protein JAAARDRAFT_198658 [Jaapia argillacea MUCL 33604]|uniref:Uncharacterized protein n=1 Tax=Jaapia argillacea MUCL 33604 TaxID=933084 RepID=A0A067PLX0_9AGAM|nr:hypothetical protein JAAARDRAFT_198658 [Jaapia argillacea MUCL 33604]